MEILFTICGRAGSKGFKNKNLKDFLGKPLALYSLSAIDLYLNKYPEINADIVLNTDSKELKTIFLNQKIRSVQIIDRSEELSGDRVPKRLVITDSLIKTEKENNKTYDYVVDLDITAPLRTVSDVHSLIQKIVGSELELVFSVTNARQSPYFGMIQEKDDGTFERIIESGFVARQQALNVYDMNGSLYAYSVNFLKSKQNFWEAKFDVIIMKDTGALDINEEKDLELMEIVGAYLMKNVRDYKVIQDNIKI